MVIVEMDYESVVWGSIPIACFYETGFIYIFVSESNHSMIHFIYWYTNWLNAILGLVVNGKKKCIHGQEKGT